jgi:hypothetical protein
MITEAEIAAAAGHPSPIAPVGAATGEAVASSLSTGAKVLKYGGRVFLVVGVGASVYSIASAAPAERERVVVEEAAGWVGGFVGGAIAGASAGLFCGPGAPVCSFVLGLTGGFVGSLAGAGVATLAYDVSHRRGVPITDPAEQRAAMEAANTHVCPNCHQSVSDRREGNRAARLGDVSPARFAVELSPADIAALRRWATSAAQSR